MSGFLEFGSPTWARTRDLRINSPSLYRLSYWRIWNEFYVANAIRSSKNWKKHHIFELIDLKINEVQHDDIGQMNMYLGYFANEENTESDNPPIGIILSKDKDELLVEYATYGMNSQLFVSQYQLYLPDKNDLINLVNNTLQSEEDAKK